jgi:hypothetical protein
MKRLAQGVLVGVVLLAVASIVTAQQVPQPVVRLGNWIEVGTDVFMHIIAAADIRYRTVHNFDFESRVRDRTPTRSPTSTSEHDGDADLTWAELRLGAEFRYQKSLTAQVLFEHQAIFDGNLIDDRNNSTNPGGTDVFGRAAGTENSNLKIERYWIDYKFQGTPLRMRVGADLWFLDQAGLVADDDPRFAIYGEFGDFNVMAAAVYQFESQRLGLQNDNDFIYYTFSGWYDRKPHRFQLDVTYFRDRFLGADTASAAIAARPALGFQGQKTDSVLIMASWSGTFGPVRALVQGNIIAGTARGGTAGLPAGVAAGRDYDIFSGGVVAYAEVDLGVVRPYVGFIFGSADGDPTDDELHGFASLPVREITGLTGTTFFAHFDPTQSFGLRDYACPARMQGVRATPPATNPLAIGTAVLGGTAGNGFADCSHTVNNPFNDSIGVASHLGLATTYSNPGTILIPMGLKVYPAKDHEFVGWYVYRGMVNTNLLEVAFRPEIQAGRISGISKTEYHEIGSSWQWTLNPYFDIRLSGNIAIPGAGYKDLARLATCGARACEGDDLALSGQARFRARF